MGMSRDLCVLAAAGSLLLALSAANTAFAQRQGGILKMGHFDSPASMSPLEESTQAVNRPMSGVFRESGGERLVDVLFDPAGEAWGICLTIW
jgi:hypothetical protein